MTRISHITRNTKETQIELSINLDGTGQADISTCLLYTSPSPRD